MTISACGRAAMAAGVVVGGVAATAGAAPGSWERGFDRFGLFHETTDICGCGKSLALRAMFEAGLNPDGTAPGAVGPDAEGPRDGRGPTQITAGLSDTDVLHVDLEIEVLPATESLAGTCTLTVRSLVDGLDAMPLRLRSNYAVTSSLVDGVPVSVTRESTTTIVADLGRVYNAGEVFELTIGYSGVAVGRGFSNGSIDFAFRADGVLVSTLSQPYYAYTWWPCKDGDFGEAGDNSDKFTLDMSIIADASLRSVSNGVLAGVDALPGNRSRYRWEHRYPIPTYLVAFATAPYNTYTRTFSWNGRQMPVEINVMPADDTASVREAWFRTVDMLAVFSDALGEYPFIEEKYGVYQFPFSGGMEHQTNSGQGTTSESVTAHELGHQWLGDDVTCRTWSDIWINEGGATFTEALWFERRGGLPDAAAYEQAMLDRRPDFGEAAPYVTNLTLNNIFNYSRSYEKGAWVYHMLRGWLGDDAFFDALAAFRAEFSGSAVDTLGFRDSFERSTGEELDAFFDQWVFGSGEPDYAWGWQTASVRGRDYLRLFVRQDQTTDFGANGRFVMPIRLAATGPGLAETVRVFNDERAQHFTVPLPAAATSVAFDPDNWILRRTPAQIARPLGPPVVVEATLAGAADGPTGVSLVFIEPVVIRAGDIEIVSGATSIAPASVSADADLLGATVTFPDLAPGAYTLVVRDSVRSLATGLALDGEGATLPSGDGLAGGDFELGFVVASVACEADLTGDGAADIFDILAFFDRFAAADPSTDLTGDGTLDLFDILAFFERFALGC